MKRSSRMDDCYGFVTLDGLDGFAMAAGLSRLGSVLANKWRPALAQRLLDVTVCGTAAPRRDRVRR
jgi:hypothetical protein